MENAVEEMSPEREVYETVGARLKAGRERLGMSLADLAAQTRVPTRHLESIERSEFAALPGQKLPEYKFALSRDFQPADWKQSWSRGIADLVVVHKDKALVADYKTGKRKPTEQLDLYAAYTFAHFPEVQEVTTMFIWLKDRKIDRNPIQRTELPMIWQGLLPRAAKLESAYERDSWPPRPSGLCNGWCGVKTCKYNKDRS